MEQSIWYKPLPNPIYPCIIQDPFPYFEDISFGEAIERMEFFLRNCFLNIDEPYAFLGINQISSEDSLSIELRDYLERWNAFIVQNPNGGREGGLLVTIDEVPTMWYKGEDIMEYNLSDQELRYILGKIYLSGCTIPSISSYNVLIDSLVSIKYGY